MFSHTYTSSYITYQEGAISLEYRQTGKREKKLSGDGIFHLNIGACIQIKVSLLEFFFYFFEMNYDIDALAAITQHSEIEGISN